MTLFNAKPNLSPLAFVLGRARLRSKILVASRQTADIVSTEAQMIRQSDSLALVLTLGLLLR